MDVKETKEALKFALNLAQVVGVSLEDGKVGLEDLVLLLGALSGAGEAFKGLSEIPAELGELSNEEKDELKTVVEEFDIPQEAIEDTIQAGLKLILDIIALVSRIK